MLRNKFNDRREHYLLLVATVFCLIMNTTLPFILVKHAHLNQSFITVSMVNPVASPLLRVRFLKIERNSKIQLETS